MGLTENVSLLGIAQTREKVILEFMLQPDLFEKVSVQEVVVGQRLFSRLDELNQRGIAVRIMEVGRLNAEWIIHYRDRPHVPKTLWKVAPELVRFLE